MANVVIIGGGPGGYEAALVGRQLGGKVTLVDPRPIGGAATLTDVVPSKSLIATAEVMTRVRSSHELGLVPVDPNLADLKDAVRVDLASINKRLLGLAAQQSQDIESRLLHEGVTIIRGRGRLLDNDTVFATTEDGEIRRLQADMVLVATGTRPRELPEALPRPPGRPAACSTARRPARR